MIIVLFIILILILALLLSFYFGFFYLALYLAWFIIFAGFFVFVLLMVEAYRVIFQGNAPYIRTNKKIINKIIKEIDFKENALVYELGCGDARFLRALSESKKIRSVGYEYFVLPYALAQFFNLFSKNKVKVYFKDFFKEDLSQADYIFCYLITGQQDRLEKKLKAELKPGAMVISNTFAFKNWQPLKTLMVDENKKSGLSNKCYIYVN